MDAVATSVSRAQDVTAPASNERIRTETRVKVAYYATRPEEIDARLAELDREWGVERLLQINSAALSLAGLALGLARGRPWLLIPAVVQSFFLQHGVQGWCPPLPVFRKLGVRTMPEIDAERSALKALRGDYAKANVRSGDAALRAAEEGTRTVGKEASVPATTSARVPANTAADVNERIRRGTEERVAFYAAHPELIGRRLGELDQEWDVERVMEVEAPAVSLAGILLGTLGSRRWLAIPLFAQSMMLLHAVQGFYPLLPLFRRMGLRTEQEIAAERYALKALRGDFDGLPEGNSPERADAAFEASQPAV